MNTKLIGTLCLENTDGGVRAQDPIFEKACAMAIEIAQFVCYNNSDISE